jgi:amino acid adenylation domain-containing protein
MQQGMVFHSLYANHSGVDIEQVVYTLHENLSIRTLQLAWQQVINRHSILRTSFRWEGLEEPVQQVHTVAEQEWLVEDWREQTQLEEQLSEYLKADRQRGFTLTESSLNRFALFRIGDKDYQFVWTFHHAILDGRSLILVLKEAFACYEALVKGEPVLLSQPRPYRDYITWLAEQNMTEAEAFWRTVLKGFTTPTPLVVKRNDITSIPESPEYTEQGIRLSESLTSTLKKLAQENSVTLNNFVQGAWALLLSIYSGEEDVVFGVTRACRHSTIADAESVIGPFINTLPMRFSVSGDTVLLDWLQEIRRQHVTVRKFEHTPLMKIQKWSETPRGVSLFDTILVFENYELDSYLRSLGENWSKRNFQLLERTNYPLALSAWGGRELLMKLAYHQRDFDDASICRMLGHLKMLLEGFAVNPHQRLSDYQILTREEYEQIVIKWNDTNAEYPANSTIHQLFEEQVKKSPNATAVSFADEQLTFQDLNQRANHLAHHLQKLGVQADKLVAICLERSPEMIVGILGILKAGGAYVPLDPAYPQERLSVMLKDAQPTVLLTQQRFLGKLPATEAQVVCIDSDWQVIAKESLENPDPTATADNLAYVIYTSGSTGKPKGVMIEHRSLVNFSVAAGVEYGIAASDRILQFASISFDASAEEIFPALTRGAMLVLRNEAILTSISMFLEMCRKWQINILDLPTAYWHELAERLGAEDIELPPSLRLVIIGGERVLPERLAKWRRTIRKDVRLVNTYGPTEATIVATMCDLTDRTISEASLPDAPIGKAVPNVQTYILDRYLRPLPIGIPGELYIGGAGLARGYLNQPEQTAKRFVLNPFDNKERLYKSGDVAKFLSDGQIEFCGRIDNQVKIHGFRIELEEIEAVIAQHPMIGQVTVVMREDIPGEKRLIAYIVPSPTTTTEATDVKNKLRSFLKNRLPAFMNPSVFILLGKLPVTVNGKIDKKALPALDLHSHFPTSNAYVKPKNPLHYQLVQIWEELFDSRPIGITDNFFDLGGHSLLSVRLMDRIEQTFGKRLELATLFSGATIEYLATALLKQTETHRSPLVAIQPNGIKTPFYYLHGDFNGGGLYCLKLARYLGVEQPFYALQPHGIDGEAIPKTIEEMAADHITTLRAFQPQGPYQIGGHCNGGLIAFEMARQLDAMGESVSNLVLIGATGLNARFRLLQNLSRLYGSILRHQAGREQELFLQWRERLIQVIESRQDNFERLRKIKKLRLPEQISLLSRAGWQGVKSFLDKFNYRKGNDEMPVLRVEDDGTEESLTDFRNQLNEDYVKAMLSYVPRRYAGKVSLLLPAEWIQDYANDLTMGWGKVAAKVDVHIIAGGHLTCLVNHMDELAQHLRWCLEAS